MTLRLIPLLFALTACYAQDPLAAPTIGFRLTPGGTLSQVQGVPGAARLVPVDDTPYTALCAASANTVAVVVTPHGLVLESAHAGPVAVDLTEPTALAISPNGRYFGAIAGDTLHVYTASGVPLRALRLSGYSLHAPAIALSDDGTALVTGRDALLIVSRAEPPVLLSAALTCARFAPGSSLAAAYDTSARALVLLHTTSLAFERLSNSIAAPSGLEFADAFTLWLSDSTSLTKFSLDTRALIQYTLDSPGALSATGTPGVFWWTDRSLLDTLRPTPRELIVTQPQEAY